MLQGILAFQQIVAPIMAMGLAGILPAQSQAGTGGGQPGKIAVELRYSEKAFAGPFTGRVHLIWMPNENPSPPRMPNWGNPFPHHFVDVQDWKAGVPLVMDGNAKGYPAELGKTTKRKGTLLAVMDRNLGGISFGASPGNVWGATPMGEWDPAMGFNASITLDKVVAGDSFRESERVKLVRMKSPMLTNFAKQDVHQQAAIVLPEGYDPKRAEPYPFLVDISGFGGDHRSHGRYSRPGGCRFDGVDFIVIVPDPNCRFGHHVFADSDNNGPVGTAFVTEFLPAIENRFHCGGKRDYRLLTGHSSGGWSSLWLMVAYPSYFGGTWSTAPDPVDFHDFQKIDLYQPQSNIFTDEAGKLRPLSRGGRAMIYKNFHDMEQPMKRGGQLQSFQAVFGPAGEDGFPKPLWDNSGKTDPAVFEHWKPYDIVAKIEREWPKNASLLKGRIHVYMGTQDTFLLEGAVVRLKALMDKLDPTATVELVEGKDHGSLMSQELVTGIRKGMAAASGAPRTDPAKGPAKDGNRESSKTK